MARIALTPVQLHVVLMVAVATPGFLLAPPVPGSTAHVLPELPVMIILLQRNVRPNEGFSKFHDLKLMFNRKKSQWKSLFQNSLSALISVVKDK